MTALSLICCAVAFFFAVFNLLQTNLWRAGLDFGLIVVLLANLYSTRHSGVTWWQRWAAVGSVAVVVTSLYLGNTADSATFVWYFTFPLITFPLLGCRQGGVAVLLLAAPPLLPILFPGLQPFSDNWPFAQQLRTLSVYTTIALFSYLMEYFRERSELEQHNVQARLEQMVQERTEALRQANALLTSELQSHQRDREALKASEERYRIMFERSRNAIFLVDRNTGRYLEANPAAEELTGRSVEELRKLTTREVTPEGAAIRLTRLTSQGNTIDSQAVYYLRPDGSRRAALLNAVPLSDSLAMGIAHDITELQQAEQERNELTARLAQSQKLEAIGTLAGGIAHDFNNILTAIIGNAQLATIGQQTGQDNARHLQSILTASERARKLIQQILTFSRRSEGEYLPVRVDTIVEEVVGFLHTSLPSSITITRDIPQDLWCRGDAVQLHQICMNLCTNAIQAMITTGGNLSLTLAARSWEQLEERHRNSLPDGRYVALTIEDTGCGMEQETLARIFEPFFTTKAVGAGTGLGLAVVHGIVKSMGGLIEARSEPGIGTRFDLLLPGSEKAETTIAPPRIAPVTGRERLLVIDDEKPLAQMVSEYLGSLGYQVETQFSAVAALKTLLEAEEPSVDLIVSDMTMPEMNGLELARQLHHDKMHIPIILCSGFLPELDQQEIQRLGIRSFLKKPYYLETLAAAIRNALDEDTSPRRSLTAPPPAGPAVG